MPTSWNQKIASRLGFLKKQENKNYYKAAEKTINKTHRNVGSKLKTVKRFFTGEGEMMKTYKMIRTLYEANDTSGLMRLKQTLENTMPPHWVGVKYNKQLQLIGYIDYLLNSKRANNTTRRQMRNSFVASLDTSHEIGRLMRANVMMENVPMPNNNSVAANNYGSPNNYVSMPNGSVYSKTGTPIVGGRTRRRRGSN